MKKGWLNSKCRRLWCWHSRSRDGYAVVPFRSHCHIFSSSVLPQHRHKNTNSSNSYRGNVGVSLNSTVNVDTDTYHGLLICYKKYNGRHFRDYQDYSFDCASCFIRCSTFFGLMKNSRTMRLFLSRCSNKHRQDERSASFCRRHPHLLNNRSWKLIAVEPIYSHCPHGQVKT